MTVSARDAFFPIGFEPGYAMNVRSRSRAPGEIEDIVKLTEPQPRVIA